MTVSERIFELIKERGYTQKEFSKKTGIAESTISDWKKKGTNPVSDKILMICEVLEVSPYFLLSGAENKGERSRENRTSVVPGTSDTGELMACYEVLDAAGRKEALKYLKKLAGEGIAAKEPAGTGASVKPGDTEKPKAAVKTKDTEKPKDTAKPKATAKPAISHLPDIRTIASEEADYLIKASEEEDGIKKKKDKKDKSGDKDKSRDKKKKDKDKSKDKGKDKSKDKGKDKKKKKKGYLLDR